ncbi:uncharacterized protein DS421_9g258150 [Arachis hypogaea]|nr:uncharacterized protein DS421_9g258150 [Arachis hypogaea]
MSESLIPSLRPSHFHFTFIVQHFSSTILIKVQRDIGNAITLRRALSGLSPDPPRRVLASRLSPLCSAACTSLRHVTRVSSQSLASHGSPVSSPAAEATRGVVSCVVAFRLGVADSPSTVGSVLASTFKWELGAGEDNNIFWN